MRKLYSHILSPACRKVRIALAEKALSFDVIPADFINYGTDFLAMNPTGEIPVLKDVNNVIVSGANVICEYLDEEYTMPSLLSGSPEQRAEIRRLAAWFDEKFAVEVTFPLLREKVLKSLVSSAAPDSKIIRESKARMKEHFNYIKWLIQRRTWLAGDNISYADIAAAAQISVVDYLGDVDWDYLERTCTEGKEWYVKIKSRPSFKKILTDRQNGFIPPPYYSLLDF